MKNLSFDKLPEAVANLSHEIASLKKLIQQNPNSNIIESNDKLLTVKQAAELLDLSISTIYTKTTKREIPFIKKGKRVYFSQKEILEHYKTGRVKTKEELRNDSSL